MGLLWEVCEVSDMHWKTTEKDQKILHFQTFRSNSSFQNTKANPEHAKMIDRQTPPPQFLIEPRIKQHGQHSVLFTEPKAVMEWVWFLRTPIDIR